MTNQLMTIPTMKTYLASLLRHALTALAGLGAFLLSNNLIEPADAPAVDAAGVSISAALVVIGTAVLGRLAITLFGKFFTAAAGESGGPSGGMSLLVMCGTAAGLCMVLPSCSAGIPIKGCLTSDYGTACYSSKSGLEIAVNQRSSK